MSEERFMLFSMCIETALPDDELSTYSKHIENLVSSDSYPGIQRVFGYRLRDFEPNNETWYRLRGIFGDRCIKTLSDIGGVKIGNENFSVVIPNGRGDGITRIAVFDKMPDESIDEMHFWSNTNGEFYIYGYDCGDNAILKLSGKYLIYYYDGLVAFIKYE